MQQFAAGVGSQSNLLLNWRLGFLTILRSELVFEDVTNDFNLPAGQGSDTVQLHRYADLPLATVPLIEGQNPTEDSIANPSLTTIQIKEYGSFIKPSSKFDLLKPSGVMEQFRDILARQAAATLNSLIQTEALTTSSIIRCGGQAIDTLAGAAAGSATTLSVRDIARIQYNLRNNNARKGSPGAPRGFYLLVADEKQRFDLMSDAASAGGQGTVFWIDISKYIKPDSILEGSPYAMFGVAMAFTTEIDTITDSGQTVYRCLAFADEAIGSLHVGGRSGVQFINKKPGPSSTDNPLDMFQTAGWKMYYATKLLDANRLFKVYAA